MFYLISLVALYSIVTVTALPAGFITAVLITGMICHSVVGLFELFKTGKMRPLIEIKTGGFNTEKSPAND